MIFSFMENWVPYKFNEEKDFMSQKVKKQNKRRIIFNLSFSGVCYCQTKYWKWIASLLYYVVNNCENDHYRIFTSAALSIRQRLHHSFLAVSVSQIDK